MIKELFLPETLFGTRLLSSRIVSFYADKEGVRMAQVRAAPKGITIEALEYQPSGPKQNNDTTKEAIEQLYQRAAKPDTIVLVVPASLIVFKELTLPFSNPDKIRMVIDFELESLLPFPVNEAIIDFVITQVGKEQTRVLAAAIRKSDLQETLELYLQAGVPSTSITVDIISLYNLYKNIPAYASISGGSSIVDVGFHSTRVSFLQDGALRLIRTIPKGLLTITDFIAEDMNLSVEDVLSKLTTQGVDDEPDAVFKDACHKQVIAFFNGIQFSLNSFSLMLNYYGPINKILFSGTAYRIANLMSLATNVLQTPCELFHPEKILDKASLGKNLKIPKPQWHAFAQVIGAAIPAEVEPAFDLQRKEFQSSNKDLIDRQIYTACALIIALFLFIIISGYLRGRKLSKRAHTMERAEVTALRKIIKRDYLGVTDTILKSHVNKALRTKNLKDMKKSIDNIVKREETTWLNLAKRNAEPLTVLYEITNTIDRMRFNITTESLHISVVDNAPEVELSGILIPQVSGQDYHEWQQFETDLEEKALLDGPFVKIASDPEAPLPEGGVRFSITLRKKEE